MKNLKLLISLSVLALFVACTPKSSDKTASNPKEVNLAIWTNYVSPELLAKFEKQTGIKVLVSNYSSNEELLAKIQAGAEGYDVAVPSDYMVLVMNNLGLLTPIDKSKITRMGELDPKVLGKYYDPKNEISLPFSWGTTGIAYNQKFVKKPIRSYKDLFESKEVAGKFTLLDDVREALGAALKLQSITLNTRANADLEKAKKVLLSIKKDIKGFTSETAAGLTNGEMLAAQAYSVDAMLASSRTNGAIKYVIPEEGCTLWVENLVIPKGSKNVEAAHKLIDFLLSEEVGVERAKTLFSAPSNRNSIAKLPEALQKNPGIFPDSNTLARCEILEDLGDGLAVWDRTWTEVKASQ